MNTLKNKAEILDSFRENPDMMAILTIIRDLELKIPGWQQVRSEILSGISCQKNQPLTVKQMWTSFSLTQR